MKSIKEADIEGKKVFLRVDFNVPMEDGKITDDNRIVQALPTIKHLIDNGAKTVIGTHLGKPEGREDMSLSTMPLANRLSELLGREVVYAGKVMGPEVEELVGKMNDGDVLLLENLRFNPGEEENDAGFGESLAKLAEIYCNDAFAVCHRKAASTVAITEHLESYGGFLIEKEVEELSKLTKDPAKPFIIIIGGVKIEDKAGAIKHLGNLADKILVGGGVGNTFMKAAGEDIKESVYDQEMVDECKRMMEQFGEKIIIPVDYQEKEDKFLDIGDETVEMFKAEIANAKTVFWNGNLGYTENEEFAKGSKEIAEAISNIKGIKVAAGGDTVGFIQNHNPSDGFTFISTGGGAALEYLAGKKLPGIEVLSPTKLRIDRNYEYYKITNANRKDNI